MTQKTAERSILEAGEVAKGPMLIGSVNKLIIEASLETHEVVTSIHARKAGDMIERINEVSHIIGYFMLKDNITKVTVVPCELTVIERGPAPAESDQNPDGPTAA